MVSNCPQCGEESISSVSGAPEGKSTEACENCGYVVGSPTATSDEVESYEFDTRLDWGDDGSARSKEAWMDFSTVSNGTEANLARSLARIEEVANQLGLSDAVRKCSAELYAEAMVEGSTDGRDTKSVVAACIRIATRQKDEIYPDSRITEASGIEDDVLRKLSKKLRRELDIPQTIPTPADYVSYLSTELGVDESAVEGALQILEEVGASRKSGKSPISYAAASLYLASDEEVTQREAAIAAGITKETVRVRLREIEETVGKAPEARWNVESGGVQK